MLACWMLAVTRERNVQQTDLIIIYGIVLCFDPLKLHNGKGIVTSSSIYHEDEEEQQLDNEINLQA